MERMSGKVPVEENTVHIKNVELMKLFLFFPFFFRYDICTYKNKPCGTLGESTEEQSFYTLF